MMKLLKSFGVAALLLVLPLSLNAALIPLSAIELPFVAFGVGSLSYNPAAGDRTLHIEAPASLFFDPAGPPVFFAPIFGGQLIADIELTNDNSCSQVGVGSFVVTGSTVVDGVLKQSPLLVGNVMQFGSEDSSVAVDKYELRVKLTGGSLLSYYPSEEIGVEIVSDQAANFMGDCAVAFSGNAKGQLGGLPFESCDVDVVKIGCVVPDPDIPGDDCKGGLTSIGFTYTGLACSESMNSQDPAKAPCIGDATGGPVDIIVSGKAGKTKGATKKKKRHHKGKKGKKGKGSSKNNDAQIFGTFTNVNLDDMFVVDASATGNDKLGTELNISVVLPNSSATVLQTIQMHVSCSQPINVGDSFGALSIKNYVSRNGGMVGGDPTPPDDQICVTEIPAPVAACSEKGDKLFQLDLEYRGGDCTTEHSQDTNKVGCTGDAGDVDPVDIKIFSGSEVYLDVTDVMIGEVVSALASEAGVDKMKAENHFEISQGGQLLQEGFFHTSCSQPLAIGNRFGALDVAGIGNTLGTGNPGGGVDVEYTITVTNPNSQTLSVFVSDPMLGIADYYELEPDGGHVDIVAITSIDGPTSNTVTVEATLAGQVCAEAQDTAEITEQEAPPAPALCTRSIQGTVLRYDGPPINEDVTIEFEAKEFDSEVVVYELAELLPGTILTLPSENDMTIDASAHGENKLGSRTRIRINGVQETIHTSCSALYERNQPAPLDGESGTKGDPSDNWFVIDFTQKP